MYLQCVGFNTGQPASDFSEDCLYFNLVRPSGLEKNASIPVAIWIHGGGFINGAGIQPNFNMSFLVQQSVKIGKPIIGINLNYRLGTLGFLSGSDEIKDFNSGLLDQRMLLEWVQENIRSFGGDPSRVTIFGESAGAGAVGYHLTAHGGRDDKLFHGAIMESGSPINVRFVPDKAGFSDSYKELTRQTGCADKTSPLQCLRALPYEQLYNTIAQSNASVSISRFNPVVDGEFVRKRGSVSLEAGEFIHIPIMSGGKYLTCSKSLEHLTDCCTVSCCPCVPFACQLSALRKLDPSSPDFIRIIEHMCNRRYATIHE